MRERAGGAWWGVLALMALWSSGWAGQASGAGLHPVSVPPQGCLGQPPRDVTVASCRSTSKREPLAGLPVATLAGLVWASHRLQWPF